MSDLRGPEVKLAKQLDGLMGEKMSLNSNGIIANVAAKLPASTERRDRFINASEQLSEGEIATVSAYRRTYQEISQHHVRELDVLERLKTNVAQLEDLHGRLKFMMSEVSYLLKNRR